MGRARANELRDLVQPYILQRTKADYLVADDTTATDERADGNNNTTSSSTITGGASMTTTSTDSGGTHTNSSAGPDGTNRTVARAGGTVGVAAVTKTLPPKRELVLWVGLTTIQRSVYKEYLAGEEVHQVRTGSRRSPLAAISHLKKCTASALLVRERQYRQTDRTDQGVQGAQGAQEEKGGARRRRREQRRQDREASAVNQAVKATMRFGADTDTETDSDSGSDSDRDSGMVAGVGGAAGGGAGGMSWEVVDLPPPSELVAQSGKLCVLLSLLDRFKSEGHRSLVFSQSVRMLNMVERWVRV